MVEKWPDIYDRPRSVTMNADIEDLQIVDWKSLAPCGWHVSYWFNQPELEGCLIEMAGTLPSVTLMRRWTAIELSQNNDSAELNQPGFTGE